MKNPHNHIKNDVISWTNRIIFAMICKKRLGMDADARWIWQFDGYPHFEYDMSRLEIPIQTVSRKQGELAALSRIVGSRNLSLGQLKALENEILSSCAIEGEVLDRESVRSSIKEKLGIENIEHYSGRSKESNYVDILIDANKNYDERLTIEKILSWHHAMFEYSSNRIWRVDAGSFRHSGTMQVVSGVVGKEKVFYEAPPSESLDEQMLAYMQWFDTAPPSLIKAAISHLWFVIIHPFDDGNGRITRAITDRVLSQIEKPNPVKLYSMSKAIEQDRKGYYQALERTTGYIPKDNPMDITYWCEWFMFTLDRSLTEAIEAIGYIVQKAAFWDRYADSKLNSREIKVLNSMLEHKTEELSTKKYVKIANTTTATASRDIKDLVTLGCIKQVEGTAGRSVRYVLNMEGD